MGMFKSFSEQGGLGATKLLQLPETPRWIISLWGLSHLQGIAGICSCACEPMQVSLGKKPSRVAGQLGHQGSSQRSY